jgi:hypothetical protein
MTTLGEVRKAMAAGERVLGALVYWRALSTVSVERQAFRDGLRSLGLGKALGAIPRPESLLNRACGVAMRNQDRKRPAIKLQLKTKGTHSVYAVLARRDDHSITGAQPKVRYLEEALITLDRTQTAPVPGVFVHPGAPPDDHRDAVTAEVLRAYADLRDNVHTEELSDTLIRAMAVLSALALRTGVYFVPSVNLVAVHALQDWLSTHTSAQLTAWDIGEGDRNKAEAQQDARHSFRHRLGVLVETCREFTAGLTEAASEVSVAARARQFRQLEAECELFADILGDYRTELTGAINAAHEAFKSAVLGPA